MGVSIEQVARAAGVSVTTVSRVFGERGKVAATTRDKVLQSATRLGYSRSTLLPRVGVRRVAVAMPQEPEHWQLELSRLVTAQLQAHGVLTMTPLIEPQLDSIHTALSAGASLIVTPTFSHLDVDVPVVRFDETSLAAPTPTPASNPNPTSPTPTRDTIAAKLDLATGLSLAFEHLTDLGHRRIGLVCKDSGELAELLTQRFIAEHPVRGLNHNLNDWIVPVTKSYSGGIQAALKLGEVGVTAVIVQGGLQLYGVLDAIRKRGLMVPRDMSVVGFGDSLTTQFTGPPATVLALDVPALASALAAATRTVLGVPGEPMKSVPPNFRLRLLARGSTAAIRP